MADWYDCTPAEAEDEYYNLRWSYKQDSARSAEIRQQCDNIAWQQSENRTQQNNLRGEALNFERRIEDLERVAEKLEGQGGGWLGRALSPNAGVEAFNNKAKKTGSEYTGAIKCTGVTAANIASLYRCPTVSENAHSSRALQLIKNECERLREAVRKINEQIAALEEATRELAQKAAQLESDYSAIRSRMNSTIYDMNHFAAMM